MSLRTIHRVLSLFVVVVTLYLGVTGSLIGMVDLRTIITDPSPYDPDLMAMREDFAGPGDFRVLGVADNLAAPLPRDADLGAMLATVLHSTRLRLGDAKLRYVELRMADGRPVGSVQTADAQVSRFDAASGAPLPRPPAARNEDQPPASLRNTIKHLHRMTTFGDWALWINVVTAASLAVLIVTGIWIYGRMLAGRARSGRRAPFWLGGGTWRALHRSVSIAAAVFLTVITLSGSWLAVESLVFGMYLRAHMHHFVRPDERPFTAIDDAAAPRQLATTLSAFHALQPGVLPRVIRLRTYGTMPQGVVITDGHEARQFVFDTDDGRRVSLTEPGYPDTGFPFGWQAHQTAKAIHRGSYFGLTGRITSLLAGLSMIYLSISGIVMYVTMWRKRRAIGRRALIWG